jgi:hypothetical protein
LALVPHVVLWPQRLTAIPSNRPLLAVPLTTPLSVRDCRETSPVYQPFGAVAGDDIGRAH